MLQWNDAFATGHPQVDQEHKILIDRLNELEKALMSGQGKAVIEPMLRFLEDYTVIHFTNEEACFNRLRCPFAAENVVAHKNFLNMFTEAKKRMQSEGATTSLLLELHRALGDWVRNHILRVDCKVRHSLAAAK